MSSRPKSRSQDILDIVKTLLKSSQERPTARSVRGQYYRPQKGSIAKAPKTYQTVQSLFSTTIKKVMLGCNKPYLGFLPATLMDSSTRDRIILKSPVWAVLVYCAEVAAALIACCVAVWAHSLVVLCSSVLSTLVLS